MADRLRVAKAGDEVTAAWKELVAQDIRAEEDDENFYGRPLQMMRETPAGADEIRRLFRG